jgi:hypothetical protein
MRNSIFIGMKEWPVNGAGRLIEPHNTHLKIDLHNYSHVESIRLDDSDELIFTFRSTPYEKIDQFPEGEWCFELVFHGALLVHVEPSNFLPYTGQHDTDDFLYEMDKEKNLAHIKWFGDSNSAHPDPAIEFWADTIEYKRIIGSPAEHSK